MQEDSSDQVPSIEKIQRRIEEIAALLHSNQQRFPKSKALSPLNPKVQYLSSEKKQDMLVRQLKYDVILHSLDEI